ncbi:MAG: CHAP domain-containing protein [Candidatus Coprovivens sp.]
MSYSSKISGLKTCLNNVNSSLLVLNGISLDDDWKGNASDTQLGKLEDLISALNIQKNNIQLLIDAMDAADKYDNYEKQKQSAENTLNSYSSVPNWWNKGYSNYNNALKLQSASIDNMNTERNNVNNKLSSITEKYETQYSVIEFNDIIETKSIFDNLSTFGEEISKGLDLNQVVQSKYFSFDSDSVPDWNNLDAWQNLNPYVNGGNTGQCTWFAWGRFYEMYGYKGWSNGNGRDCARNLVNEHPDDFYLSDTPETGSVFSYKGGTYGHVGVVLEVKDGYITFQDGNMNGHSDSFQNAQSDWRTKTMTVDEFLGNYNYNIEFANPR